MMGHFIIGLSFNEYINICRPDDDDTEIRACPENTSIFYISNMQYLITAFAFCISKPFKSPIYTNYFLTFFMIFAFLYSCFIILFPFKFTSNLLQLYNFDNPHDSFIDERRDDVDDESLYIYKNTIIKYYIQAICIANLIVSYLFEKVIVPCMTSIWNKRKIKKLKLLKEQKSEQALNMKQLFLCSDFY